MLAKKQNCSAKLRSVGLVTAISLLVFLAALAPVVVAQDPGQKTYASAQDAGKALYDAIKALDKEAMLGVLGSSASAIVSSGDEVQDKNNRDFFTQRYEQMNRWGKEADGSMILYIGAANWPLPVPLKKAANGQWYFDSKAGEQEILFRRIGKNELAAIRVCNALADAQHEYFDQLHDGDTVHQYAQKIISEQGKQNGLYWKVAEGETESPVGPLVAYATGEGYGGKKDTPQPFHGYFFRTLKEQGAAVKGGAKSYIADGKMTGGFAFLAYPAEYRNSGVMTFLINQDGVVYEKDLGATTVDLAGQITAYNPDKTWHAVNEDTDAASDTDTQ
jgi:hypothetical protein